MITLRFLLLAVRATAFLDPSSLLQFPVVHDDDPSQDTPSSSDGSIYYDDILRNSSPGANYSTLLSALEVMQSQYFSVARGTWPLAIDWTAAVMGTQISATLSAISDHVSSSTPDSPDPLEVQEHENLINRYFTQVGTFYFGEDDFGLRLQAFDDMLWVVLGWLEGVKFVDRQSRLYDDDTRMRQQGRPAWYGSQFVAQFAHRARIFYGLASKGWDTVLCGGGMLWSPYVSPYKNAVTNQLYIAASISMYLYFPGDDDDSPFLQRNEELGHVAGKKARDDRFLENAIEAYDWLEDSGMKNRQGLYVDGFHIRGWRKGHQGTGNCDERNEMVYTYNQGVILTGLRGLWEATGKTKYLTDGHELIENVIAATGWPRTSSQLWTGLGRGGVLEDACDIRGSCSQNGQTFKGIFFHHFSTFCAPLKLSDVDDKRPWLGHSDVHLLHRKQCEGHTEWVVWNAEAALSTKDEEGRFGQWWVRPDDQESALEGPSLEGTDYRNEGVPEDELWRIREADGTLMMTKHEATTTRIRQQEHKPILGSDINDRGRGRTVESQSGGLAVVRAAWKLLRLADEQHG